MSNFSATVAILTSIPDTGNSGSFRKRKILITRENFTVWLCSVLIMFLLISSGLYNYLKCIYNYASEFNIFLSDDEFDFQLGYKIFSTTASLLPDDT
jgi:hypothetical protein